MIALCANVKLAVLKGASAVFEEVMLEVAEVNIVVVGLLCRWSYRHTRGCQNDDRNASRQSSWEKVIPKSMQSRLSWM